MANTTLLKTEVESFIKEELKKLYSGSTVAEKGLPLYEKRDGTLAIHKFDAVSNDNTIVASIKSHSWKTSGGKYPAGKVGALFQALYLLSLADARTGC